MDLSTLTDEQLDQLITQKQQPAQDLSSISDQELDRMIAEKSGQQTILPEQITQSPDV